jgi:hypothetical protein
MLPMPSSPSSACTTSSGKSIGGGEFEIVRGEGRNTCRPEVGDREVGVVAWWLPIAVQVVVAVSEQSPSMANTPTGCGDTGVVGSATTKGAAVVNSVYTAGGCGGSGD